MQTNHGQLSLISEYRSVLYAMQEQQIRRMEDENHRTLSQFNRTREWVAKVLGFLNCAFSICAAQAQPAASPQ